MFLDLDEFWTPNNFLMKVYEMSNLSFNSGSISFPWYIDEAKLGNLPFNSLFDWTQNIYPNQYVKSMIRVKDGVTLVHAHNARIDNDLDRVLCTGRKLPINDGASNGSIIPIELFDEFQKKLPSAFVYHVMHKSQVEYMSALLKPNIQDRNTKSIFKDNRNGYINNGCSLRFEIPINILNIYNEFFLNFLNNNALFIELEYSRIFILQNFTKIKELLNQDRTLLDISIFKGLSLFKR